MPAARGGAGSSLGIDVSEKRGLDLVLLDAARTPVLVRAGVAVEALPGLVAELQPDVVAVDAPCRWGTDGGSRAAERELRRLAIQSYGTPSDPVRRDRRFYSWMKVGMGVYAAIAARHPVYETGDVRGTAVEVFPHATSVVLAGCLPPSSLSRTARRDWRLGVLARAGVATAGLRSQDAVDAALAALTGLLALGGDFVAVGRPEDGVIVVPGSLSVQPYRRCPPSARRARQPRLPGLSPCACGDPGCRELTRQEFAPGHDAKRKTLLWQRAREGREAREELRRRGWELPPEMRSLAPSAPAPARARRSRP